MKKENFAKMKELLDSDDEFPMEYFEEVVTPAYKNDHRFDMIHFKWISNDKNIQEPNTSQIGKKSINCPIISNGILNKKDLFCLKSLEGYGDATFIWFVNFLIHKDLQSDYIFLRSCLVHNYLYEHFINPVNSEYFDKTNNLYTVKY